MNDILVKKYDNGIMEQTGYRYCENVGSTGIRFKVADFPIEFKKIFSKIIATYDNPPNTTGRATISYPDKNDLYALYCVSAGVSGSKAISWQVVGTWK